MKSTRFGRSGFLISLMLSLSAGAAHQEPRDGLWVTFDIKGEQFHAVVTDSREMEYVREFAAGKVGMKGLVGAIRKGSGNNAPWSWHLDPDSVKFVAEASLKTMGCASDLDAVKVAGGVFCTSQAKIIRAHDCTGKSCERIRGLYSGRSPAASSK